MVEDTPCRLVLEMLRRSALRNIPLRLQLAYGAAKNPLELWQNAASRRVGNLSCRKNRPRTSSTRVVTMHDARHWQRLEGRQQANRRRRCPQRIKGMGWAWYPLVSMARFRSGKAPPSLVHRHRRLLISGPRGGSLRLDCYLHSLSIFSLAALPVTTSPRIGHRFKSYPRNKVLSP